jgi:hypothetical protein
MPASAPFMIHPSSFILPRVIGFCHSASRACIIMALASSSHSTNDSLPGRVPRFCSSRSLCRSRDEFVSFLLFCLSSRVSLREEILACIIRFVDFLQAAGPSHDRKQPNTTNRARLTFSPGKSRRFLRPLILGLSVVPKNHLQVEIYLILVERKQANR